jgi:hypothetical protein
LVSKSEKLHNTVTRKITGKHMDGVMSIRTKDGESALIAVNSSAMSFPLLVFF